MELADWDLHAVVRSCTSTSWAASPTATSPPTTMDVDFTNRNPSNTDLHTHQNNLPPPPSAHRSPPELAYGGAQSFPSFTSGELQDLCSPFNSNLHFPSVSPRSKAPAPPPYIPLPSFRPLGGGLISEQMMKPQQQQQQQQRQHMAFQHHLPEQQQAPPKRARFVFGTTATIPSSSVTPTTAVAVSSSDPAAFSISNITPPSQSQRHQGSVFCSPASGSGGTSTSQSPPKTKKRKNLQKKVFHVSAEGLSSDMWAWRKYGQKPIKGSPYPRGYYRCSSSKGCLARKQVERNRSDPKMFIVTYTAEHNHPMPTHRNSLAGSTRQKPTTSADAAAAGSPSTNSTGLDQPGCSSSPSARLSLSPNNANMAETLREPKMESFEDEDPGMMENVNEMEFSSDAVLGDDFFAGFGDLDVDDDSLLHDRGGDGFAATDRFRRGASVELELPWLVNGGSVGGGCSGQPLVADGS